MPRSGLAISCPRRLAVKSVTSQAGQKQQEAKMALLLVSYDLISPGQDYPKVEAAIKGCGTAKKVLFSQWALNTSLSAGQVRDRVMNATDRNDKVLVCPLSGWAGAHLDTDVATFIGAAPTR
jgi:hypothetical protein